MKTVLIKDTGAITKAIISIANRGKKLDADIQLAGLSVLAHVAEHKDTTLADKLVMAAPRGDARTALTGWILAHGNMRLLERSNADEAAAIKAGRIFKFEASRKTDMDGAEAKPWHTFKKEASPLDAFDAQAMVMNAIARIQKATKDGITIKGRDEALAQLDALRTALTAQPVAAE